MPRKRTTLPKDFDRGDPYSIADLEEIFARTEVSAVSRDYARRPALHSERLDVDGIRWLLDHGAPIDAVDAFGSTALAEHVAWRDRLDIARLLLERGADPDVAKGSSPLSRAAERMHADAVLLLLEHGADPALPLGRHGVTALDVAMTRMQDHSASAAIEIARIFLDRGVGVSGETPKHMRRMMSDVQRRVANGRGGEETPGRLMELFRVLGVAPPAPPRVLADGEPITVTTTGWRAQHAELWAILVPPGGPAASVQGEVIRIAGRIANELLGNGGANWDRDFAAMLHAVAAHVRTGAALEEADLAAVDAAVAALDGGGYDEAAVDALTERAVTWVLRNPARTDLPAPRYRR